MKPPGPIAELVSQWFTGECTLFDAVTQEPDIAWEAIRGISARDLTDEQQALLASGPLETLLVWHGPAFIDRVLHEAGTNTRFRGLLGGIWPKRISKEVWARIESAREGAW